MAEWEVPIWITAQLCVVLYLAGVGIPHAIAHVSYKDYKKLVRDAVGRYDTQKRVADQRRYQSRKRIPQVLNKRVRPQPVDSSDTSSSSSSSESEEEMHNDRATLMQYLNGNDLFDGQSCTTSASAASTMIKKMPHKPGSVRHL